MKAQTTLGAAAVFLLAAAAYTSLFASPPDAFQGEYVRIMYAHVPNAWVAYLAFAITFVASVLYVWKRRREYDHIAHSATELGVLFTGLALATGSIWGRPVWGTWWTWDARLVTTAMLFLIYSGALLVRGLSDDPQRGARLAAGIGIIGFLDVPDRLDAGAAAPIVACRSGAAGPRGRLLTMKRIRLHQAAIILAGAVVYLILGGRRGAIVYYATPSEVLGQGQTAVCRAARLG